MKKIALAALFTLLFSFPALAISPGDACTVNNAPYRYLVCDGSQYRTVFTADDTGILQPQFTNTASCSDGDTLTYDATTGGMTCGSSCSDNTPNTFNFTDNASASASTLTTSNILQISGMTCEVEVTISGEGSPQYRICSDSSCTTVLQDWTSGSSGIDNNEYVQLRLTTSAAGGDTYTATLTAGNTTDNWNVTPTGNCTGPSPAPGTVCADGTVYAGLSPVLGVKMYTSRCDEGRTWSGSVCTGPRVELPWNNGNSTGYVSVSTNDWDGDSNTTTLDGLDSDSATSGNQPHRAAQRCADLTLNGHSDWYLPAEQELNVVRSNQSSIGDFHGQDYWSSSEGNNSTSAVYLRFSSGLTGGRDKKSSQFVRCVRR